MKSNIKTMSVAAMAALAMVSCSNHDSWTSYEDLKKAEYDAAFVKKYGTIDPNHDWGFGSVVTRAVNVNGNLWEEMPEVTQDEREKVFNYVNYTRAEMREIGHKYAEVFPENLVNYWVTHVWTGTDTYDTFDHSNKDILGSEHMDELQIAESADATIDNGGNLEGDWFHVNNFNAGNNTDWNGNTLVENSGTFDFAYNNSSDSKYHNKWITVDGADISPELAGYYYVCFDFIGIPNNCYTNFQAPGYGNVQVPGAYNSAEEAVAAGAMGQVWEWDQATQTSVEKWIPVELTWTAGNVVGGNMAIPANDVYTDWIIRLVKATPADEEGNDDNNNNEEITYAVRIFCEDLGAIGDFDFNDVVFDALIKGDKTYIKLLAAGGTMNLTVAGHEVHKEFGEDVTTMINTGAGPDKTYVEFVVEDNFDNDYSKIPVVVTDAADMYNTSYELKNTIGHAPQKLCVPVNTGWTREYKGIELAYPAFKNWVVNANNDNVFDNADEEYIYAR